MSTTDITSTVTLTARERRFLTGILLAEKPTDAVIVHVGEHGDTVGVCIDFRDGHQTHPE